MTSIKTQLDNSALISVQNNEGDTICSLFLDRVTQRYTMKGITGMHSLCMFNSNADRIQAHWDEFVKASIRYSDSRMPYRFLTKLDA